MEILIDEVLLVTDFYKRSKINAEIFIKLTQSIKEIGLQLPITVVPLTDILEQQIEETFRTIITNQSVKYFLVRGFHRFMACQKLKFKTIEAEIVNITLEEAIEVRKVQSTPC